MSRLILGAIGVVCAVPILGCASYFNPDKPYVLIKSQDGWVRLATPPPESAEIVAAAGTRMNNWMNDKENIITWFQRGPNDDLIYSQVNGHVDSEPGCGDEAYEFRKVGNRWVQDGLSQIVVCGD